MSPGSRFRFNISGIYPVPRLGISYLVAFLRKDGFIADIVDIIAERWDVKKLVKFIELGNYTFVGMSTTIASLGTAFRIARFVKSALPYVKVCVGGPGTNFSPQVLTRYGEYVDFFIRGEGEIPILKLAEVLEGGGELANVPGLVWKQDGVTVANQPPPLRDFSDGIMPAWDAMPMAKYKLHPPMSIYPPATLAETSRGCPFPCTFCCLSGSIRVKPIEMVEDELTYLSRTFGIREIHFIDPTFTLDKNRVLKLCSLFQKFKIKWSCKTRPDCLDSETARAMAESGCYLVMMGVESGSQDILENLGKGLEIEKTKEAIEACRRNGIKVAAYLMVGVPGETDQSVDRTIKFVARIKPDYVLYSILEADPGNLYTRKQIERGILEEDDIMRYYLGGKSKLSKVNVSGHDMRKAQKWLVKASLHFYFSLRSLKLLQQVPVKNILLGGIEFVKDLILPGRR